MALPNELLTLNSDVSFLARKGIDYIEITEVYYLNGRWKNVYGIFNSSDGLKWTKKDRLQRRDNLYGMTLKSLFLNDLGYTEIDKTKDSHFHPRNINKISWSGMCPEIYESLAENLNFSFALVMPKDRQFGSYNSAGKSWNGAIRELTEGVADVAPISFFITTSRAQVIDFSVSIVSTFTVFLVGSEPTFDIDIYIHPFEFSTWCVLYLILALLSLILALAASKSKDRERDEFGLMKSFTFVYGAFAGLYVRRWSVTPNKTPGRYLDCI